MFRNRLFDTVSSQPFFAPDGEGAGSGGNGNGAGNGNQSQRQGGDTTIRVKVEGPDNPSQNRTPDDGEGQGGRRGRPSEADLRAEAAGYRIEARKAAEELEKTKKELEETRTGADKRVQEEVGKLTQRVTKMQQRVMDSELKSMAVAAGLEDLDLLPLIDKSSIKIDDDGNVTGVQEAIDAFKTKKPNYFKTAGSGAGADGKKGADAANANTNGAGNEAQRRATGDSKAPPPGKDTPTNVKEMTDEQYAAWKKTNLRAMRHIA